MNANPGAQRRKAAASAAVLAGISLLAAACSGGGSTAQAGSSTYQKAVAYAQCMRARGVPGFPDPDTQGDFLFHGNPNAAQYLSANKGCEHLLPNSGAASPAQQQDKISAGLKFSACMRSHGVTKFPDPVPMNGGAVFEIRGPDIGMSTHSPQFQSAAHTCDKLTPVNVP